MSDRWKRLLGEVWRFFAVAQAATWVSFLLFNVLVHGWVVGDALMPQHALTAYVLANSVGMVISYHGARGWVFPHRPPRQADGGWTAYVIINLAAMAFPVSCLALSRHVLGLESALADNVSANLVGLVLAFGARFYLFRRFVFRRPEGHSAQRSVQV
ncbi:GtrA family protein [Nocardioides sp. R-C-SC26]|uniref:GtrA family protein n=1 Tax=Nocardioides sp. R-C-SC26 TaxID=2870414 RepID=UPI001E598FDA|nr:GtrA family protein [Nocardioides sp. R-C-SC26]